MCLADQPNRGGLVILLDLKWRSHLVFSKLVCLKLFFSGELSISPIASSLRYFSTQMLMS
ncbi:hypothetical protein E2C01_011853 [Portunus trituberculatus]|uniref:Uncharacterized protein n=1 Tax=Portunus trituberculatus TaxID=210409 RepID=A0A5B7DCG1_PORTR|nr:hypothetical protein [Portunus trituberculatus]